jgi:F-box protein 11
MPGDVFVSYSRLDQAYVDRLVALLRERGAKVWIDHQIDYGSRWATVIQTRIRDCSAMLVVMTRASEASQWVQREINEAEHWHKPIFPLLREGDRVWFRLSDYQSEVVTTGAMPTDGFVAAVVAGAPSAATTQSQPSRSADRPGAPSVPSVVVDVTGRGDYDNLASAVTQVTPGTLLLVQPGVYTGNIRVEKPMQIIGDGPRNDIILEGDPIMGGILWTAGAGRLENLTIVQHGDGYPDGVLIYGGGLEILSCDISGGGLAVSMNDGRGSVKGCRLHHCKLYGLRVSKNSRGTFEDNDITSNGIGISVSDGADPVVRANRVTGNKDTGLDLSQNARGTFEHNEFTGSNTGIRVSSGADPLVRANQVSRNNWSGIAVLDNGHGTFEDNDITGNGKSVREPGAWVDTLGAPVIRNNRLSDNGAPGIHVLSRQGTYENNSGGEVVYQ